MRLSSDLSSGSDQVTKNRRLMNSYYPVLKKGKIWLLIFCSFTFVESLTLWKRIKRTEKHDHRCVFTELDSMCLPDLTNCSHALFLRQMFHNLTKPEVKDIRKIECLT